jgi:hypothetical protein
VKRLGRIVTGAACDFTCEQKPFRASAKRQDGKSKLTRTMKPNRSTSALLIMILAASLFSGASRSLAQAPAIPASITMPDKVESPLGTLEFRDGAPSAPTAQKLYDNLDFLHAQNVFLNTYQGASTYAMHKGILSIGVEDNSVIIFPTLMDSKSLFLTANADTVYYFTILNLTKGPMVIEVPPHSLGTIDDMWWGFVTDAGVPGPDRGEGGKYLILPPGYDGPLPDSGYNVARSRTTRAFYLGRSFMEKDDPKPVVELVRKTLKIYPYTPGGYGTSVATLLEGKIKPGPVVVDPPPTKFTDASGKSFNTVPPRDYTFYEMIDALIQEEPTGTLDPELMGQIAAIGIVKGKPFKPDARMKKDPHRCRRRGQRYCTDIEHESPGVGGIRVLSGFGVDEHALCGWLQFRGAAADGDQGGDQALPKQRRGGPEFTNYHVHRLHRDHSGDVHAVAGNRLPVPHR